VPVIQNQVTVPANGSIDNVIAGSQFEFLPYDAALRFGLSGTGNGLVVDVYSGQDVLAEQMAVSATSRIPINPDDYVLSDVAGGGERVKIRVRNTTAGPLNLLFGIIIDPL
jgi:hypothetical protein